MLPSLGLRWSMGWEAWSVSRSSGIAAMGARGPRTGSRTSSSIVLYGWLGWEGENELASWLEALSRSTDAGRGSRGRRQAMTWRP